MTLERWLWLVFGITAAVHLGVAKFIVAERTRDWQGWAQVVRGSTRLQIYSLATPAIFAVILIVGFLRTDQGWWYLIAVVVVWILPPALPTPGLRRRMAEKRRASMNGPDKAT
jgi:hypothetical protein